MQKIVVFNHIPKTAGSTIRGILAQNVSGNMLEFSGDISQYRTFLNDDSARSKKYDLIHGHVPYGIHEKLDYETDPLCFTFLRDPISRFISEYTFGTKPNQGLHNLILGENLSIKSFIDENKPWLTNPYIKFVSGNHPGGQIKDSTDSMLETSISTLRDQKLLFGVTEYFDESILLLAKKMRWKAPVYIMKNVAANKLGGADVIKLLPTEIIEELRSRLTLDYTLYDFAVSFIKEEISIQPPSFWTALEELREVKIKLHDNYDNQQHRIYAIEGGADSQVTEILDKCTNINSYLSD